MEKLIRDVIAENLRRVRREQNLSQEELASRSGLTVSYISLVERKKESISLKSLGKISKALGISPMTLLKEVKDKKIPDKILDEIMEVTQHFETEDSQFLLNNMRSLAYHIASIRSLPGNNKPKEIATQKKK